MICITKEYHFSASHQLPFHDGKCADLHGHNYRMEVSVESGNQFGYAVYHQGPQRGMLVDFGRVDDIVEPLVDSFDHTHLNDHPLLEPYETTAETIAHRTCDFINLVSGWLEDDRIHSVTVRVWETDRCSASVQRQFNVERGMDEIPDDFIDELFPEGISEFHERVVSVDFTHDT